ncbi:MAG: ABC transporter transmembrane domain-containing protein [Euzebya sp.]
MGQCCWPVRAGVSFWQRYSTAWVGRTVATNLRRDLLAHLLDSEMGFHDHARVGQLMTRVTDVGPRPWRDPVGGGNRGARRTNAGGTVPGPAARVEGCLHTGLSSHGRHPGTDDGADPVRRRQSGGGR